MLALELEGRFAGESNCTSAGLDRFFFLLLVGATLLRGSFTATGSALLNASFAMSARVLLGPVLLLLLVDTEDEDAVRGSFTASLSTIAGALLAMALLVLVWRVSQLVEEEEADDAGGFAATGRVRTRGPCAVSPFPAAASEAVLPAMSAQWCEQ